MAILSGAEARAFASKNPQGKWRQVNPRTGQIMVGGGMQPQPPQDLISSLLQGLVAPAQQFTEGMAERLRKNRMTAGGEATEETYKPIYTTPERYQQIKEQPGLSMLQDVVAPLTYFIPGGGSVTGMAAKGALGGGALGFAQADPTKDVLRSTIEGAAGGATVAGGLGLAGKGLSKVAKAASKFKVGGMANNIADRLEGANLGIKAQKDVTGALDQPQITNEVVSLLNTKGQQVNAPGMGKAFQALSGDLDNAFASTKSTVGMSPLLGDYMSRMADEGIDIATGPAKVTTDRLFTKMSALGENAAPGDVAKLIQQIDNQLKPAYKKLDMGNPLTDAEMARLQFRRTLSNALKTQVPEAGPIYANMELLNEVAPDVIKQYDRARHITAPLLGGGITVPTGGAVEKARNTTAGLLRNAGNIGADIPGLVNKVTGSKAAQTVGGLVKRPLVQQSLIKGLSNPNASLPTDMEGAGLSGMGDAGIEGGGMQQDPMQSLMMAQQMLGPGAKPNEIISLAKYLDTQTKTSAAENNKAQLNNAVGEMERLYGIGTGNSLSQGDTTVGPGGLVSRVGQDLKKSTNQDYANRLASYKQMTSLAAGILNQARGAGTLNSGEFEVMMQNIPNEYTSEEQARDWFSNVRAMLARSTTGNGSVGSMIDTVLADNTSY
jgi:hypothetical protein